MTRIVDDTVADDPAVVLVTAVEGEAEDLVLELVWDEDELLLAEVVVVVGFVVVVVVVVGFVVVVVVVGFVVVVVVVFVVVVEAFVVVVVLVVVVVFFVVVVVVVVLKMFGKLRVKPSSWRLSNSRRSSLPSTFSTALFIMSWLLL